MVLVFLWLAYFTLFFPLPYGLEGGCGCGGPVQAKGQHLKSGPKRRKKEPGSLNYFTEQGYLADLE